MAIKVDDLELFALIARQGSVTKAAEKLYMAQQSLSAHLKSLEARVGTKLFTRSTRGMELTDAGRRLLPYAEHCSNLLAEAVEAARGERARLLHIHVHAPYAAGVQPLLTQALAGFDVAFHLEDDVAHMLTLLEKGGSDAVVAAVNDHPEGVALEGFDADPLVCVALPSAPAACRGRLNLADLGSGELHHHLWHLTDGSPGPGQDPLPQVAYTDGEQPPRDAVWMCSRAVAKAKLDRGELVQIPVSDLPRWQVQIFVAYRADEREHAYLRAIKAAAAR